MALGGRASEQLPLCTIRTGAPNHLETATELPRRRGAGLSMAGEPAADTGLRRLPLVPLRDDVVFPKLIVPLSVGRRTSIAAISFAMDHDKQVLLVAQKDPQVDDTADADLYATGTIAEINGMRQTRPVCRCWWPDRSGRGSSGSTSSSRTSKSRWS